MDGVVKYRNVAPGKEDAFFEKYGQYNPVLVTDDPTTKSYMSTPFTPKRNELTEDDLVKIEEWVGSLKTQEPGKDIGVEQPQTQETDLSQENQQQIEGNTELDLVKSSSELLSSTVDSKFGIAGYSALTDTLDLETIKSNNAKLIIENSYQNYPDVEKEILKKDAYLFDQYKNPENQLKNPQDVESLFEGNTEELNDLYNLVGKKDAMVEAFGWDNVNLDEFNFRTQKELEEFNLRRNINNKNIIKGNKVDYNFEDTNKRMPIYDLNKDGIVTELEITEYERRVNFITERNEINKGYLQQLEQSKIEAVGLEYDQIIDKYQKEIHTKDLSLTDDFKIKTDAVVFYNGATNTYHIVRSHDWRSFNEYWKNRDKSKHHPNDKWFTSDAYYYKSEYGNVNFFDGSFRATEGGVFPKHLPQGPGKAYAVNSDWDEINYIFRQQDKANRSFLLSDDRLDLNPAQINYKQSKIDEQEFDDSGIRLFNRDYTKEDYDSETYMPNTNEYLEFDAKLNNEAIENFKLKSEEQRNKFAEEYFNDPDYIERINEIQTEVTPLVEEGLSSVYSDIYLLDGVNLTTPDLYSNFKIQAEEIHALHMGLSLKLPKDINGNVTKEAAEEFLKQYNKELQEAWDGVHYEFYLDYNNALNKALQEHPYIIERQAKFQELEFENNQKLWDEYIKENNWTSRSFGYSVFPVEKLKEIAEQLDAAGFSRQDNVQMQDRFLMLQHYLKGALKQAERENPEKFLDANVRARFVKEYYDYFFDRMKIQSEAYNKNLENSDFWQKLSMTDLQNRIDFGYNRVYTDRFGNTQMKGLTAYYPKDVGNKHNDGSVFYADGSTRQPAVIYESNIMYYLYSNSDFWKKERNKYPNDPVKQYEYAAEKYGVTEQSISWAEQTIKDGGRYYETYANANGQSYGKWHEIEGGFDPSKNLEIATYLLGQRWLRGTGNNDSFIADMQLARNMASKIIEAPMSLSDLGDTRLERFWNGFTSGPNYEWVPFFGWVPEAKRKEKLKRLVDKDPSERTELEEQILIAYAMKQESDNRVSELSSWYNGGKIAKKSAAFVIEFASTSGVGSLIKTTIKTGIKKSMTAKLANVTVDKTGKLVLSNGMKLSTGYQIADKAIDFTAFVTSITARSSIGGLGHTINGTIGRMTDEVIWSFSTDADGLIDGIDAITASDPEGIELGLKKGEAFTEAFARSYGMTFGEYMTESIGFLIPGMGRRILNIPGVTKIGGRYGDMVFDSDVYKRLTLGHFMREKGFKTAAEVTEWMAERGGWHGILGELGEEYINIPWQNLMEGHGTPLLAGFLEYDINGNPVGIDWGSQQEMWIGIGSMGLAFTGGGAVVSQVTGRKGKYYEVSLNNRTAIRYNSKEAMDRYLKRLESDGFFNNPNNKIYIKTYNDYVAADEYRTLLETYRLAESSMAEIDILEDGGKLNENQKGELLTINNRLDELNGKRFLTEAETLEKKELESRKIELTGGIELRHTIEADGTNKLTTGKTIVANELDILSVDEKDGGLDDEGRQRLLAINDELAELNGKRRKLTEEELKRKQKLEAEKQKLIGDIEAKIIQRKTKRAYNEQVKKVKAIIEKEGLTGKIQITEEKGDKETRKSLLELFGLTEENGKFFDIEGNEVTNIGIKKDKDGKTIDEGQKIEDIFKELQTTHGYFIPADMLGKGEKSHIIINMSASFKNRGENVASHEFFHWYLSQALSNTPELRIALGESFKSYLMSIDPKGIRDSQFRQRLESYMNEDAATQSEEAMALFLDAMASGELAYKESLMQKIGAIIKHLFRSIGVDITLNTGKDVYDFIKDFNDSMQRGDLSASLMKALEDKIKAGDQMIELSNKVKKFQKEQKEAFEKKFKEDLTFKFIQAGVEVDDKTIEMILKAFTDNPTSNVKKSKTGGWSTGTEMDPAEINEQVYQEILDNAKKNNIPNDKLKDAVTRRMREKLFVANMAAANKYAAQAYAKGKAALKGTDFVAAALEDLQQEFYVELHLLTERWNPSTGVPFGAYVQMPKGLPIKYGQVLNRALQKTGLVTQSQAALEEAGYQFTDNSTGSTNSVLQEEQDNKILVRDQILNLPDNVIANIESAIKKANIKLKKKDGSAISYKEIKQEVIKGKLNGVLADVGNAFGIPTQKLVKKSDLNNEQRTNARNKIVELAKNNNLIDLLPEAQDQNATSTEIVRTKFGQFYEKIADRASTAGKQTVGGQKIFAKRTGGQKALYAKMDQVPNQDILDIFGINQDGSFQSGTRYDGAIREFAIQLATAAANQELRLDAARKGVDKKTIEDVASGKSRILFAKGSKAEQVGGEFINTNETIKEINPEFQDDATRKFMNMLLKTLGYKPMYDFSTKENIDEFFDFVAPLWISVLPPNVMSYQYFYHSKRVLSKGGDIVIEVEGKQIKTKDYYKQRLGEFYIKRGNQWFVRNEAERKAIGLPPLKIGKPFTGPGAKFKHQTFGGALGNTAAQMRKSDKDGTVKRFNEINLSAHQQFWSRINESIKNSDQPVYDENNVDEIKYTAEQNKENTIRGWGNFLRMVGMDVTHIHRMGEVIGYSPNPKGGRMKPSKKNPEGKFKLYEWEHAMQATLAYLYIFESIIEPGYDFDTAYDLAMQNYKIIALDYFYNQFLERAGRAKSMGKNWNIFMSFLDRYFDTEVVRLNQGFSKEDGISTSSIIRFGTGEQTFKQYYDINNDGSSAAVERSSADINTTNNLTQAISNRIMQSKTGKTRGMSTFDFDDTLGFTKSGVRVTMPNPDGTPKPKRKVIFLAGGAGSGKGNVINKLGLEGMGFKIVNSDISLEWLKKNSGLPADMRDLTKEQRSTLGKLGAQARKIARGKMMKYQGEGNGVIVDGTGGSAKQMQKLVDEFQSKGYDVSMLFVNTSLDVALERNRARKERSLLDIIVKRNHEAVQNNKPTFKEMFGKRFMEVNTDKLTQESPMPKTLVNKMNDFVSGYEKRRIDATEFAEQGAEILEQGGKFDFSEFNDVVDGTPGPLLDKAKERAAKFGTKDMFVLTARPQASDKAIHEFLKSQGLNIPLKNITGLANSTGEAKAKWMLEKFAEGYNDLYFVDDALANVEAVREVLDQLDVKSKVVQARVKFSKNASIDFNKMLERKKGIPFDEVISGPEAKKRGKGKGRWDYYIPPSAEDFKGLLYYFIGKGKQGEEDLKFLAEYLLKPFARGIRNWNAYKQSMVNDFKNLKKRFPKIKLNKKIKGTEFTNDTAIRVYLWDKSGFDIEGLSVQKQKQLVDYVNSNPDIKKFADALSILSKRKEGYLQPSENWMMETIPTDLRNIVDKIGRKEFLQEWIENKNIILSRENINKIEAVYGSWFREALEDILFRMENGGNRKSGGNRTVNFFTEWINDSIGAIMFFNMRSALLQTISTVNFINWGDNNLFKAAGAFANQPQFWADFVMLFNSDQLKQRRGGLQTDVSASELTKSFAENGYSPRTLLRALLQFGFTPTQIADSFAIAFGGASFYRNRYNTYIKKGMTPEQANEQAMLDFQEIAEETQQSSREDLISQQQATLLGRFVLAFQNVTMQYGRLTKKALSDLVNNRGDIKTNVSKILYYGLVQNIVFSALQSALAFIMWGDDEEEIKNKTDRVANNVLDSFLRGTGLYGALVSTLKNTVIQWNIQQEAEYGQTKVEKVALATLDLSPPIGSKVRKIVNAFYSEYYDKGVSDELGLRIESPQVRKWAYIIEGATNIPLARLVNKANNLEEAVTGSHETWKRVMMAMGWSMWELGVEDEELEAAKETAETKREEKKKIEKEKEKEQKKKEKELEKKKEEQRLKDEGYKSIRCSGIKSNGKRCSIMSQPTKDKKFLCYHHMAFTDGMDRDGDGIKEYRCTGIKKNGKRCKNKTENENKRCYAHQ